MFCGRTFRRVENASGLDTDLQFVDFLDAECAADFKERGRVEAGQPLYFLDHLVTPGPGKGARFTPETNDLEATIEGRSVDLRPSQQCGGVLVQNVRAVVLNLHGGAHLIGSPMIWDNAATLGSSSAIADCTSRRSACKVKIRCRIHRMTFTG